jgi:drug/metabolite transporter (DMT)-like permease
MYKLPAEQERFQVETFYSYKGCDRILFVRTLFSMPNRNTLLILAAFAVIYVVWGSTYLVNYLAIQTIPPLLMSGTRFVTGSLIMLGICRAMRLQAPTPAQWRNGVVSGILLLAIGTGGVVWAEQFVDTGIAALIVSIDPLIVVLLLWALHGKKPGWNSVLGAFLGITGVILLVSQQTFFIRQNTILGVAVIFVSMLAWAFAMIFVSRANLPKSSVQVAGMQMLAGGVFLLLLSGITGEYKQFDWNKVTTQSMLSWFYLLLFGSIIAFSAFNYLLTRVSPEKVATSTYVNPVIAVLLGWALNGEQLTAQTLVAAGILLTGVFFINTRFGKKNASVPENRESLF